MKKLIIVLLIFCGCGTEVNEQNTIRWISEHKKPIICRKYGCSELGCVWTLVDSLGNVFQTGLVNFNFPDTIQFAKDTQ